jgi:hypothetical protein
LFGGCPEGIVQGILGQVEVAEQADQGGKDTARLAAIERSKRLADLSGWLLIVHRESSSCPE